MGESACLMHTFSHAPGISNEAKQGNPIHALGESISFGRFMSESLSWEKWSSFSHNRYVEEAERYAQPGSVAQKKAFFEAHYKRIAAKKAAALLEQENAANASPEPEFKGQACEITTQDSQSTITSSQVPVDEQLEVNDLVKEVDSDVNVIGYNSSAQLEMSEHEVGGDNPMKNESLNQSQNVVSEMGLSVSPQMEKPLLEGLKPSQVAPSPLTKRKKAVASSKSVQCKAPKVIASPAKSKHRRAPKVPASPAKLTAKIHAKKENIITPITGKSPIDSFDKKRSTSKSLRTLIYCTPAKEPDKSKTPAARKAESSRVAPSSFKAPKDCKTPLRTPIMAYENGALKNPSATPRSESGRLPRTPDLDPSASGSRTTGPKWHILPAVCSKTLSACRNKLQSPTVSAPFSLWTEERAARRKQKLEEKFNAKEAQKVQLQTKIKEKAETELKRLRQNLCFKARPLPNFYKERETPPMNHIKNAKAKMIHPQSPKLGRKQSSSTKLGMASSTPERHSARSSGPNNVLKKKIRYPNRVTSLPERIAHENTSPNIQNQSTKSGVHLS